MNLLSMHNGGDYFRKKKYQPFHAAKQLVERAQMEIEYCIFKHKTEQNNKIIHNIKLYYIRRYDNDTVYYSSTVTGSRYRGMVVPNVI